MFGGHFFIFFGCHIVYVEYSIHPFIANIEILDNILCTAKVDPAKMAALTQM